VLKHDRIVNVLLHSSKQENLAKPTVQSAVMLRRMCLVEHLAHPFKGIGICPHQTGGELGTAESRIWLTHIGEREGAPLMSATLQVVNTRRLNDDVVFDQAEGLLICPQLADQLPVGLIRLGDIVLAPLPPCSPQGLSHTTLDACVRHNNVYAVAFPNRL
jgi:hypothetical protein